MPPGKIGRNEACARGLSARAKRSVGCALLAIIGGALVLGGCASGDQIKAPELNPGSGVYIVYHEVRYCNNNQQSVLEWLKIAIDNDGNPLAVESCVRLDGWQHTVPPQIQQRTTITGPEVVLEGEFGSAITVAKRGPFGWTTRNPPPYCLRNPQNP